MKGRTIISSAVIALVVGGLAVPLVKAQDGSDAASEKLATSGTTADTSTDGAERVLVWSAEDTNVNALSLAAGAKSVDLVTLSSGCRIIDTRFGSGVIADGGFRDFSVLDAAVPGQGGAAGGCKVPADAVAVQLSLSTVSGSPTGVGFLRMGPGGAAPTATVLQFLAGQGTSVTTTTALTSSQLRVASIGGATNVVADVIGYYRLKLYATVASNGNLVRGSGVSATYIYNAITGYYIVQFNRDVQECTPVATPDTGSSNSRVYAVLNGSSVPNEVFVYTLSYSSSSTLATGFQLALTC